MKVWVYVEGESDRNALDALWQGWRDKLRNARWGIKVIPLDDKARFFRKIGAHVVEKLNNYRLEGGRFDRSSI